MLSICVQDTCPTHSTKISGQCKCNKGYLAANTAKSLKREVVDTDYCTLAYYSSLIINNVVDNEIILTLDIGGQIVKDIALERVGTDMDNPLPIVLGEDRLTIEEFNDPVSAKVHISGLKAGRRYMANVKVEESDTPAAYTVSFPIVPSCSCDALTNPDKTGRPKGLEIFQDQGHVMFTFIDNSRCETAFSFTRFSGLPEFTDDSDVASSFANDYVFTSPLQCGATVSPGFTSSDDLQISRLLVGDSYSYCVRSTNSGGYMDLAISDEEQRVLQSSTGLCESLTISWEASVDGKITTLQNAGSLPIKDVEITWQLLSEDGNENLQCATCTNTTSTDEGGAFSIYINAHHPSLKGKNAADIPIRVSISKTTRTRNSDIDHIFLCNGGQEFCDTNNGYIFYLKHLHFDEPLHIYDDTSVNFSGKVITEGTSFAGNSGCPINEAEVCMQHKSTLGTFEDLICVTTNSNGEYEAPIVIGSTIDNIDVRYHQHEFERTFENKIDYSQGLHISSGGFYAYNDFMDLSKAKTTIQGM